MSSTQSSSPHEAVLSVNAGSSSLKFAVYPCAHAHVSAATLSGLIEGLEPGGQPRLSVHLPDGQRQQQAVTRQPEDASAFAAALRAVREVVSTTHGVTLRAVAHRIVHGGSAFHTSVRIDTAVLEALDALAPLAPLHQPHNLAGVRAFMAAFPELPQIACFDTAFHTTTLDVEQHFALPASFFDEGVRRYGFHGLSYRYVSELLADTTPGARGRVLLAHLGNGASLCALHEGRSQATTMGFSALDGLMMGTRSGSIDAGVLLHLMRQGWDRARIETLLYKQSGLLGVSGVSADMRTLRASTDPAAQRAIALFTHRVVRESGALVAVLGGLDLVGFTGGIGEHDAQLRSDACRALQHTGIRLDEAANRAATGDSVVPIHAPDSTVEVWVVPTDEGRVAARDALHLTDTTPTRRGLRHPRMHPARPVTPRVSA
jgi:acetate kinase